MDHESRVCFIQGQITIFNCRLEELILASKHHHVDEKEFQVLEVEMESVIGHNAVIEYLKE